MSFLSEKHFSGLGVSDDWSMRTVTVAPNNANRSKSKMSVSVLSNQIYI